MLLSKLESLFDKPCLIPVQEPTTEKVQRHSGGVGAPQPTFKIGFEKNNSNTSLITNPAAIFKVLSKKKFLMLNE